MIEVETCLQFIYLKRDDVQVYVGYDLDGFRALMAEEGSHAHLELDPQGERHVLIISPRLAELSDPKARLTLGYELLQAYRGISK
jgi:hypothetical protein